MKNLIGQKFNRLKVIDITDGRTIEKSVLWLCQCECGRQTYVSGQKLKSGHTKSCGCLNTEKRIERGKINWSGSRNPGYKHGNWVNLYPPEWTEQLRESIRERDNHKCQYPECDYDDTEFTRKLDVHHINGDKKNCDPSNLVSLCHKHHKYIEKYYPNKWMSYFLNLVKQASSLIGKTVASDAKN